MSKIVKKKYAPRDLGTSTISLSLDRSLVDMIYFVAKKRKESNALLVRNLIDMNKLKAMYEEIKAQNTTDIEEFDG